MQKVHIIILRVLRFIYESEDKPLLDFVHAQLNSNTGMGKVFATGYTQDGNQIAYEWKTSLV